ncbi:MULTISPECIES: hypothetical protein [Corynebacterium]|uniref:hypothetical protein n=1 Tax=Corynebacterium TaxID=1716 RepID=UPI0008A1AEB0|nr:MULTISPECIES: hypothetical protein [Corynebacterium]OFT77256.1 hypothetical protein HMPREF3104_02680 [Corynebacterium sp. HMSC30G07]PLA10931.1 hypothetical protein CYJ48_11510 [Corynebacterium riegelii]
MHKTRIATCLVAAAVALAPAAAADNSLVQLIRVVNGEVETADCNTLGAALRVAGLVDADTTRSQLVTKVNGAIGADSSLRLVTAPTVNKLGDRALQCGVVKPDPVTPQSQAIEFVSQLSSRAGLPELRNLLP